MKKVLAIGNALVDMLIKLKDDNILNEFNLAKGSMQLSDMDLVEKITNKTKDLENHQASGGSAANTIHGLAHLNVETGFMGKIGNDELGSFFKNDMENKRINTKLFLSNTPTGRAIALVSPDSERTFATYLGAAVELTEEELYNDLFKGYDIFHVEGYLVQNHQLLSTALKMAKENNLKVSLDLASFNVVEDNIDFLKDIINKYVDIIFANEEEAKAYTGADPKHALEMLAEQCEIAVVKVGEYGSMIKSKGNISTVESISVHPLDTTGAGDLYAAGFLYGLINEYPLKKCGQIGAILGGKVIEGIGSKMTEDQWNEIHQMMNEL